MFGSLVTMQTVVGLVLIFALLHGGEAMFQLETKCPVIKPSAADGEGKCANSCTTNDDCGDDSWCCPNACEGKSCAVVKAYCVIGDMVFAHHEWMPFGNDDPDTCRLCWCQNGTEECFAYPCGGPIP